MRRNHLLSIAVAVLASTLAFAIVAEPALAKPSDFGDKLGGEVKAIAGALLFAVAALVGLPAMAKHEVGKVAAIFACVVPLAGFIFFPDEVKNIIEGFVKALS